MECFRTCPSHFEGVCTRTVAAVCSPLGHEELRSVSVLLRLPEQDEMEIGYVQAPHKWFPVVFDSPRNRELKDFPFKDVLVGG